MPKITQLDRTTVAFLLSEVDAAIAKVGEKHGLHIRRDGRASFTADYAATKIKIALIDNESGGALTDRKQFETFAPALYGIPADKFGAEILVNGTAYTLTGFNPNATKMPFLAKRVSDKKTFKLPGAAVKRALSV